MKLYATTTSERASKGQGGNEFLDIKIYSENQEEIASVYIKNKKIHFMFPSHITGNKETDNFIYTLNAEKIERKGKKLKTAKEEHYGQHIENGKSYCDDCKKFE